MYSLPSALLLGFLQILNIESAKEPNCSNSKLNAYLQPCCFSCELNTVGAARLISAMYEEKTFPER